METNNSQKALANELNGLSANKKVWTKPTVEMISTDTIATGNNHADHEGPGKTFSENLSFAS